MTICREQHGTSLVESGARNLLDGRHWQPWLRLTRRADGVSTACTFDRLKPVFATEEAALAYAAELGRNLADEGWGENVGPPSRNPRVAPWPQRHAIAQSCAFRSRKSPLERGCRTARHMVRALTGLFARSESAGHMLLQPHIDLYLAAATSHAELERRMRETERSAASFALTFSH